jgi:protein involved in polysaccharide export with SLBB domain
MNIQLLMKSVGSRQAGSCLLRPIVLCCFLFLSAPLFGQSEGQSQSYPGPGYSQGQTYNQGQNYSQAQSQPSNQSLGVSPNDPNAISAQRIVQILRDNPDLATECKTIVMDRLREEGRTPPGGQLTSAFVINEIQMDAQLRLRIVQAFQRHGLLPPNATIAQSGQNGTPVSGNTSPATTQGSFGTNIGNNNGNSAVQGALTNAPSAQLQQQGTPIPQTPAQPAMQQPQQPPTTQDLFKPQFPLPIDPYGDVPSLRDLYTQVQDDTTDLKRFGIDVFRNGTGNSDILPVDLPAGPDYVLGTGDGLNIHIWGGSDQDLAEIVDRTGRIVLPETGSLMVATRTLAQAQDAIRKALSGQFKNAKVDISLARVRTVRVYVVGDVQRPGAYDISSLSTPLNALFAAGGPTDQGSLRLVKHYRGTKLVSDVDLYELLLNGISKDLSRLESGDTILVPPVGPRVTVAGLVRRPAIYELNGEADLEQITDLAGGLQVSATLGRINVERVEAHKRHVTLNIEIPQAADDSTIHNLLASFHVQDNDRITISPILPYSEQTVYLEGHVFRPGKRAFVKGMQVTDLIHSYQDVLPEPAEHAEIIRLIPPDNRPVLIDFQMSEMLSNAHPIFLQPFDTVRVFGRYEFDPPKVVVNGEVLRPGEYPMAHNMTAAELVRLAGGFKRSAFLDMADVSSYMVQNGSSILSEHKTIRIADALNGDAAADVTLKPGDVVTIRQLSGWADVGASVTLGGEVVHPGTYGIGIGETLSYLLERAGGFRETAFPQGTVLERQQVKELAEKSQQELIDHIETQGLNMSFNATSNAQDTQAQMQAMLAQQKQALDALRSHPPSGRLVINIRSDIAKWKNTITDVELRDGDQIIVPKRPNFVIINGQVYNPSAITFVPGRTVEWYLRAAGGFTETANKHGLFVIHADGSVASFGGGHWRSNVLSSRVQSGDMIIAPEKIAGGSAAWRNLINTAQVTSALAIAARVATSF